jgi:signal transduction histidine kinase
LRRWLESADATPGSVFTCRRHDDLRTEVHDHGAGRSVRRRTTADDEQGRGLELLDGLIDLNGGVRGVIADTDGPGKTVYVALSLDSNQAGTD